MWYINQKYKDLPKETIDEAETMKEGLFLLSQYQVADKVSRFSLDNKCDKEWRKK